MNTSRSTTPSLIRGGFLANAPMIIAMHYDKDTDRGQFLAAFPCPMLNSRLGDGSKREALEQIRAMYEGNRIGIRFFITEMVSAQYLNLSKRISRNGIEDWIASYDDGQDYHYWHELDFSNGVPDYEFHPFHGRLELRVNKNPQAWPLGSLKVGEKFIREGDDPSIIWVVTIQWPSLGNARCQQIVEGKLVAVRATLRAKTPVIIVK